MILKYIVIAALFCNIISMVIFLYDNNAGWLTWVNLAGAIAFITMSKMVLE